MTSHWPLFRAFPALATALQPVALTATPTPVQALPAFGPQAWIKRDDLSHAVYGGNKLRKLEFVLGEMRQKKVREVITLGATGTNAGIAASMICAEENIPCTIITFPQPDSPTVQANQRWMQHFGARFDHRASLWQAVLRYYLHPARLKADSYFLFAGCSNPVSVFGYINAAFELREQIDAGLCPEPREIIVAVSSVSTLAGLTLGIALAGLDATVTGIRVGPEMLGPFAVCTPAVAEKMEKHALQVMRGCGITGLPKQAPAATLIGDYFGAGYGHGTNEAKAAIAAFAGAGIPLEGTYSGKSAAAFLATLETATAPVLFWNTFNSRPFPTTAANA